MSEPDASAADVAAGMANAATGLGWRARIDRVTDWTVVVTCFPPLARSRPERDRWPDEPREGPEWPAGPTFRHTA